MGLLCNDFRAPLQRMLQLWAVINAPAPCNLWWSSATSLLPRSFRDGHLEGCKQGSSRGETALKAENRQKAHKPQQSTELSYIYLQRMNSKVSLLTDLTCFMFIFFSLRYYRIFTFHFPSTLMSYHLPTPPSKSEMPASNMTASDHLSSSFKYLTWHS